MRLKINRYYSPTLDRGPMPRLALRMELSQLSERAMQVYRKFAATAQSKNIRAWTREEVMQGFVGDVGDLMKLVMAKTGVRHADDLDRKLAHELSDCLWSVLVLAKLYDVDLEKQFLATMTDIEQRTGGLG